MGASVTLERALLESLKEDKSGAADHKLLTSALCYVIGSRPMTTL